MQRGDVVTLKDSNRELIGLVIDISKGFTILAHVIWEPYSMNDKSRPLWIPAESLEVLNG